MKKLHFFLVYMKKNDYLCPDFRYSLMRKLVLFILLPLSLLCGAKQKVVILEPLAGEGSEVSNMEKAILRGELRKAIVNAGTYDAISRADIDRVVEELDFQRTGYVQKKDIHRLGEMSGADYLCVSTLNKSDTEYYLEAYLVDVTTGEIQSPASQFGEVVGGKMADLYDVCQELISELLGKEYVDSKPLIEDFESGDEWGWSIFSKDSRSVQVANGELRLTNYARTGTTQSSVNLPVDVTKNFRILFNFIIDKAEMMSSVGIKFAGSNTVTVNSGSCSYNVGSKMAVVSNAKMGMGRLKPVQIELVKKDENVQVLVNGAQICNEPCAFTTNVLGVFAGINTLAMLKDVTIMYIR